MADDIPTPHPGDTPPSDATADGRSPAPEAAESDAPETGDLVIDAALRDLAATPADDLDAQIEAGENVQRTLQSRLGDLGS